MKFLGRWLFSTLTILAIPYVVSGVQVDGFGTALVAAAVLGILNVTLRPLLILFTLPLTILSLGFFLLIINALVFQVAGSLLPGLHVASFGSAFFASLIVSLVSWALQVSVRREGGKRVFVVQSWRSEDNRRVRDVN